MPVHDHSKPICSVCGNPPSRVNRIRYPSPNVVGLAAR